MSKQFSLIRPKQLSKMVGQEELAHRIRRLMRKHIQKAWLFYGGTGLGKTTMMRIMAVSFQCSHQEKFGEPCKDCWKNYDRLPIYELNASDKTGAPELREFISGSEYDNIIGRGTRKVYILDEAHQISKAGQNLLLKYLEDDSNKTVWLIGSSEPAKLIGTVRRRLTKCRLQPLDTDQILVYVQTLLKDSKLSAEDLADALAAKHVDSPGIIAQAVELYVAGTSAEDAANIEATLEVNGLELGLAVTKGDWEATCMILQKSPNGDARGLRASLVGLLRKQLLETSDYNKRNKVLSDCMKRLCYMQHTDDLIIMAALAAELYTITELFAEYKR
jgi:replication-associated recombination protein RarA